jgi:hypothetical protein
LIGKIVPSILLVIVGCGLLDPEDSTPNPIPDWGSLAMVKFARDLRPVDGALTEVILTRNGATFDATKRDVSSGFGSPVQTTTESIANGMTCDPAFTTAGVMSAARCMVDTRPVDGPLIEIFFTAASAGRYRITIVKTPSGFGGNTTRQETDLGDGFVLQ